MIQGADLIEALDAVKAGEYEKIAALEGPGWFGDRIKDAVTRLGDHGVGHARAPMAPLFGPAGRLFTEELPGTPWLVRGLLQQRAVCFLSGDPKTAKTWHALEIALAVATGTKAFGEFPVLERRDVCMFLVESDRRETRNRLRSLCVPRNQHPETATENIHVACRQALNLADPEQLSWLVASVETITSQCGLLILDCLRDLHNGKENEADSMAPVMHALRALRDTLKCCIIVIHHNRKPGKDEQGRAGSRMRGSNVVHATADAGLYLGKYKGDGQSNWIAEIQHELRDVRGQGSFWTRLDVEDDDAGEAVAARWQVSRQELVPDEEVMDERAEGILWCLVESRRAAGGSGGAMTLSKIAANTGTHHKTVLKKLKQMAQSKLVAETDALEWVATAAGERSV